MLEPLAMEPGLLPADFLDEHPLPEPLIEIREACHGARPEAAHVADEAGRLAARSVVGGMQARGGRGGKFDAEAPGFRDASRGEGHVQRAAQATVEVVGGDAGSKDEQVIGHQGEGAPKETG
jgi:hypothetical protein